MSQPAASLFQSETALRRTVRFAAAGWAGLTLLSLLWHAWTDESQALELAHTEARASYFKDVLYRRWATGHGGVYVAPTERTPPNPYLTMVRDRDVVTTDGRRLTLVNPAYMTRQVFELTDPAVSRARITSLSPLNPINAPDAWERAALESIAAGAPEVSARAALDGAEHIRLMRPMITEAGCLKCHAQQGYRVGDIRGGISVSVPLAPYFTTVRRHHAGNIALHLALCGAGFAGLFLGHRRLQSSLAARRAADAARSASESAFRAMFAQNPNPMWVIDRRDFRFLAVNDAALRLYGYSRDGFLQLTTLDIRPPGERARLQQALAGEPAAYTFDGIWIHRKKSGEELRVEVSSHAIAWEGHDARSVLVVDVTERERSLERLRRSEHSLALAMDLARAGAWEFDAATATLTFNDQLYRLYATTAEQEGGYRMPAATYAREFLLPEEQDLVAREVEKVLSARAPGASWSLEHRVRRRDGEIRHFLVHITLVTDEAGRIVGSRGVNQDITERIAAEAERRRLFRAVEQSPVTIVITDLSGTIEYANPQFTRSTGYTLEEVRGKNPRVLKSGAHPPEFYRQLWQTISSGHEWRGELCNRRKDGSLFWEEATISPVTDERGQPTHYLAIKEDITGRRATLEQLREQSLLLEVTRDAIVVVDLDGRVTYWNHGAELLYEWPAAEALGQDLFGLVYDAAHPPPLAARQAIREQGEWIGELRQRSRSGRTVTVRGHGVLMRDGQGMPRAILLTAADITEAKRLEAQLLRSQRLESIGSLASGIAHDLNNVLSPIMMAVELLRPLAVTPEDRDVLRLMSDSARRGADVLRQILLFGRGSEAPSERLDVAHVAKEIVRMMRETFPRHLEISGDVRAELWPVRGRATQIYQVLLNLCVNARDAMPSVGRITLQVANRELGPEDVREQVDARPGRFVELRVADTGSGIPLENLDRIFDPFFTTKELGQGSGLGLSTVLGIVRNHGGFITVQSQVGRGTEFRVYLPAIPPGEANPPPAATERSRGGAGETVLVVDDEASIRQILRRSLEDAHYRVLTAADGAEALALVRTWGPELRALVLDMMMPGMDGLALVAAIREREPHLPIIACSGLDHYGPELVARGHARVAFLPKPFTVDAVLAALRAALDRPAATS